MRALLPLAGLLILFISAAQSAEVLTLAEAEQRAIARDAERDRLFAESEAAGERAIAGSALPDPEVQLGLQNVPLGSLALDEEPMTQVMIGIEQMFPPGDTRAYLRERGEHLAVAAGTRVLDRERQLRYAVREAWLMAQTAQHTLERAESVQAAVAGLQDVAETRYATGGGRQADYLAAKLRLDRLKDEILRARERRAMALATLRRWLGSSPQALAPARLTKPSSYDILADQLAAHPLLASADAYIAAGEAGESVAKESFGPRWKLGMSYGYRRGVEAMTGEPRDDMASVMVGFSLPLFSRDRQERDLSAARSETRAARYGREDALRELLGRLDVAWQRHEESVRQLALYEQELLPAARQVVESTHQAYADNAAGFDALVDAQLELFAFEIRRLELEERVQRARAELYYLAGEPQ